MNQSHLLLKCKDMKKWKGTFFNKKWLQINEEVAYSNLISN
jgi:hypothetical protein